MLFFVFSLPVLELDSLFLVIGLFMFNTERLVYFNKVRGVLRLMDCCVPTTSASASETTVDEE